MYHPSKFDIKSTNGNNSRTSPHFNKHNSPTAVLHHSRNISSTPSRPTFKRYSLADTRLTSTPKSRDLSYNAHLSTRIDSNSPGYSTRVVQYNEEQSKLHPIHHSKYDKLGVFPIVHFFKKELPVLDRKSRVIGNQMNSSELSRYNSPEHNRMLLEKIIKSSSGNEIASPNKSETNAKSVLDALKEISRKRIHSNEEEFMLKDDGKRMHSDYDESSTRKRLKQNLQMEDSVVSTSHVSRVPSIDALRASHSSMEGYFEVKQKKEKIQKRSEQKPVDLKRQSPVKLKDVETQTSVPQVATTAQVASATENVEKKPEENQNSDSKEPTKKEISPVKVFDETPLETMRRKRLTALMGSLGPKKVQNQEDTDTANADDKSVFGKPLVSILSGSSKSPHKSPKHVTFDIPLTSSEGPVASDNITGSNDVAIAPRTFNGIHEITKTSAAIVSPIVSASVVEVSSLSKSSVGLSSTPHSTNSKSIQTSVTPTIPFGNSSFSIAIPSLTASTQKQENSISLSAKSSESLSSNSIQIPQSKSVFTDSVTKPNVSGSSGLTSSQQGGFKFELKEPLVSVPTTTTTFSFVNSPISSNLPADRPQFSQVSAALVTSSKANLPAFGLTPTTSNISSQGITPAFNITTTKNSNMSAAITFSTTRSQSINSSVSSSPNFFKVSAPLSTTTSTTAFVMNNKPTPSFRANVSSPNFITPTTSTNTSALFNFGLNSTTTKTTAPTFTSNSSGLFDATSKSTFGNVTTSSVSLFTNNSTISTMSSPVNFNAQSNNVFGPAVTSVQSIFNKPSGGFNVSSSPAPSAFTGNINKTSENSSFSFGPSNQTFNTNSLMFNSSNNNPSGFGGDGSTKFAFGQTSVSPFGTTTASVGASSSTLSTNTFGNTGTVNNNNSNNIFGNTNTFTTSSFASNTTGNFGASNFVMSQNSPFNNMSSNDVKNNTAPFGSTGNTPFGVSTSTSTFTANTASFSTTGGFTSSGNFGQTASGGFSSAFGATAPFEKTVGSNSSAVTPFGASSPTFGNNNFSSTPASVQSSVFTFGTNVNTKPAVFSFGASEPPKSFNFSTENNANAFSPSNTSFGATSSPFNAVATNQFNLQPPGGAMFNIGTGGSSTPSRSRAQHKAKRRT